METAQYIELKRERRAIAAQLTSAPADSDLRARYEEINAAITADPPTLDQQYAAMFDS